MKFGGFRMRVAPFTTSRPRAGIATPRAFFDSAKLFSHDTAPACRVDHWEALFFQILAMLQLEKLQARDLLYKSDLTGFLCEVYLPIEGRISGLEGLKGRTAIKDLVQHYFRDSGAYVYRMKLSKVGRILREASRSKWPPSCKEVTHQHTAGPALDAQHCDPLPISSHH